MLTAFIMKDKIISILSTRLLDEILIKKAAQCNIVIDSVAFIETQNVASADIAEEIIGLASKQITAVFTSMNGAGAVIETLKNNSLQPLWNIYCIGAATQSVIRKYFSFAEITGIGKNALELSESIIRNNEKKVIFFCGNQRRDELPENLRKNGIEVKELVVYETNEIQAKIEKSYKGILFFSPSAVKSFFSVNSISADTVLFSIGDTTADAIKKNSDNKLIISDLPSKEELVEMAIKFLLQRKN